MARVLIVDGHASHTSLAFLDRAAELNIHVVSYPPHTTHAMQGLDVVVFASLKRHWQAVRDQRERETGLGVRKEDFILLYTASGPKRDYRVSNGTQHGRVPQNQLPSRPLQPRESHPRRKPCSSENTSPSLPFSTNDPALYTPTKRAKTMNFLLSKTSASYLVGKSATTTSNAAIPRPVFESPGSELAPDWSVLKRASRVKPVELEQQLAGNCEAADFPPGVEEDVERQE